MTAVLRSEGLGKKYGRRWALSDCTLELPAGRVVGLVGPNGAGKSTFLHLAVGMLTPTAGEIQVLGARPTSADAHREKVGFVGQDTPTYDGLSVADHLRLGAGLNPAWDDTLARHRIDTLGLDPDQRAGRLSGGQRAQLALTLGIAKRPELLILDEPVASLDPLARREFLQDLMEAVAEQEMTVVLSSHLVSDVERACDYLVVLVDSRVQVAGDIEHLLATHHRLTGPRRDPDKLPADHEVVVASHTDRQSTYLVRTEAPILDPAWEVSRLSLEDLVIAYMSRGARASSRPTLEALLMTWLTWRQLRASAAIAAVGVVAAVAVLLVTGPRLSDLLTSAGESFFDQLDNDTTLEAVHALGGRLVWAIPVLVGVFWGAPMVARELEAGTHQLVWTQSITRTRWLASKLAVTGLAAAVVGLLGLAFTWWCRPLDRAVAQGLEGPGMASVPRLWPEVFGTRGVVPIGLAVLGLAIGVAAGLVLRRTVPAMALTLVIVVAVQLAAPVLLQPHLMSTDRTSVVYTVDRITELQIQGSPGSEDVEVMEFAVGIDEPGAWIVAREMVDSAGRVVNRLPDWIADCAPHPGSDPDVVAACFARLEDEGFRQRVDYLPASRFWALQSLETGVLLVLAAGVSGFCFWRIRRDLT